jgi:hypothetical protein
MSPLRGFLYTPLASPRIITWATASAARNLLQIAIFQYFDGLFAKPQLLADALLLFY